MSGPLRVLSEPFKLVGLVELLGLVVVVSVVVSVLARLIRDRRRHRRQRIWGARARLVTVLAPPEVDPDGGEVFWRALMGLLRPWWARLLEGQHHLVWELCFSAEGVRIQLWVPGPVPPGLVERAVAGAWPGARTETSDLGGTAPPLPLVPAPGAVTGQSSDLEGSSSGRVVVGGQFHPGRPESAPLAVEQRSDPARALLAAGSGLGRGEYACVQILARPVTGRRVARARRAGSWPGDLGTGPAAGPGAGLGALAGSLAAGLARAALELLTPGPVASRGRSSAAGHRAGTPAGTRAGTGRGLGAAAGSRERLDASAQERAVAAHRRGPHWEIRARYGVAISFLPAAHQGLEPDGEPHDGIHGGLGHGLGDGPVTEPILAASATRELLAVGDGGADGSGDGGAEDRARARARGRAHAMASAFAVFSGEFQFLRRHRLARPEQVLAARELGHGHVVSVAELAVLAHLPTDETVPGLYRAGARALAPPPGIAVPGPDAKSLGLSDAGRERPVAVRVVDARQHLHVAGATGAGKSTLLAQLGLADIHAGRGVVLFDPKGDFARDVLVRLPPARALAGPLVVFDADAPGPPPCLNPFDDTAGRDGGADLAVDNLISVFSRVFASSWGPRTDDLMRAACLTLAAGPGVATLAELPRLLGDEAVRARALRHVSDPTLAGFWRWYEALSEAGRAQVTAPLMNKLRAVLLRPWARQAIAGGPSTVDLARVLDGGACVVRIPVGRLGDDTTALVGSLILARVWQAVTARALLPEEQRRDASAVLDEAHRFLNLPGAVEDMLAEARGLHFSLVLAHQHLGQLPPELRDAINANARNKLFFSVSPADARELARHTAPHLGEHDLISLDAFHVAARLVNGGAPAAPFTLHTQPLPRPARPPTQAASSPNSPTDPRPRPQPARGAPRERPREGSREGARPPGAGPHPGLQPGPHPGPPSGVRQDRPGAGRDPRRRGPR